MSRTFRRALRVSVRNLSILTLGAFCAVAHALPGPELLPAPSSFSNPQGVLPQQVEVGQAADGRMVVAFISESRLYVQRLTAAGAPDGATTQILQGNDRTLSMLSLSVGSAGHYAVGVEVDSGADARVYVRRFNADGSPLLSTSEPADGLLLVDFGGAATCANAAVEAVNSPAVALDAAGNLAYTFTRSAFCSTGPGGALQPDRTELYYRYAPVGGTVSDAVRVFDQSPVTGAGFRSVDIVRSSVALQDNGDVLLAWNGHEQSNQAPRTFVRSGSGAQLTGSATLVEAENSFDRSAPQLGAKSDGYVLSWRGDFNDPQSGSRRIRCYAQARARDGSAQFNVVTLASCTDDRALIVQSSGAFDVVTVPQVGQNQMWSGRRYDAGGIERGFYSNGSLPNRFLDLGPRAWAPALAGGRYLAIYNVTQDDGDESLLEPVRYGGPNVPPSLQLGVSPSVIGIGESAAFSWSSTGASSCTIEGRGEFTFSQSAPVSGSFSQTYSTPGTQSLTLTCTNAAGASASESRTLAITAPAVTVQAMWSPSAVRVGEPTTISFTSQNAQSCQAALSGEFAGGASVETTGSMTYTFTQADEPTFVFTCTGPGGTASTTATVAVTAPAPVVTAIWTPATVRVGQAATVSYASQDAANCQATLTGEFATGASVATTGSLRFTFTRPDEPVFTFTCTGPGGTATTTARLAVTAPQPMVTAIWTPATARIGEMATVSYASQDAANCEAALSGEFAGAAPVETTGSMQYTFTQPGEAVFTFTCTGAGGSATTTARLVVTAPQPMVTAIWTPATVRIGETATVSYASQDAANCQATLTGEFATGASVATTGSLQYTFTQPGDAVFTFTCTGPGGTAMTTATLSVTAEAPTVNASWSPATVLVGELATISHSSQNAQSCQATLTGEFAGAGPVATTGSMEYTFTQSGEPVFTLTCTGPGGTATTTARLSVTTPVVTPPGDPVSIQLSDGRLVQLISTLGTLVNNRTVPTPANLPDGLIPLTDFLGFDVAGIPIGASVDVTLTLPGDMAPTAFIKCLAACVRYEAVSIEGNRVRITLVDGGAGDADGIANGTIQDPGAPAVQRAAPRPTLGGGGSLGWPMLLVLLAGALARLRASQRRTLRGKP